MRLRVAAVGVGLALLCGCATPSLDSARYLYYAGQPDRAEQTLEQAKIPEKDRVLLLMERGTIRQTLGRYEQSTQDYLAASDLLEQLWTYSVSKGAASWLANDTVQSFVGVPFERTLLHCFTELNHFALPHWDNAAVEARRILLSLSPEAKRNYPEDAFSHYLAGFGLEMIDDGSNAAIEYRKAARLARYVTIDEQTGRLSPPPLTQLAPHQSTATNTAPSTTTNTTPQAVKPPPSWTSELVCFVLVGRSPRGTDLGDGYGLRYSSGAQVHAELYHQGQYLGRSYNLADTVELAFTTEQLEAARKAAKTVGRVVLKEVIASSVEIHNNEMLGDLVRLILIGLLERPDLRRWETLPRWLQVARVPCPPNLKEYDLVLTTAGGARLRTLHITAPISRRRQTFVSFCRDLPTPLVKH